jgi:hypothetical protein
MCKKKRKRLKLIINFVKVKKEEKDIIREKRRKY